MGTFVDKEIAFVHAVKLVSQTYSPGVTERFVFGSKIEDKKNCFDGNFFVCPSSGVYAINISIMTDRLDWAANGYLRVRWVEDDTIRFRNYKATPSLAAEPMAITLSATARITQKKRCWVEVTTDRGQSRTVTFGSGDENFLTICKILPPYNL